VSISDSARLKSTQRLENFTLFQSPNGAYAAAAPGDAAGMQREILRRGPIEVAFQVFSDFHSHRDGVYFRTNATRGGPSGGHAVKIVGWGVQPPLSTQPSAPAEGSATSGELRVVKAVPYWLVANSWGVSWGGLKGFFKIRRGSNECGIEQTPAAG